MDSNAQRLHIVARQRALVAEELVAFQSALLARLEQELIEGLTGGSKVIPEGGDHILSEPAMGPSFR
jgi:hypothetical protein